MLGSTFTLYTLIACFSSDFMQRHVYSHQGKNIEIFADESSLAVNSFYVRSWLDLLSRTPRVAPFLQKNDPFVMALKKVTTKNFLAYYFSLAYLALMKIVPRNFTY